MIILEFLAAIVIFALGFLALKLVFGFLKLVFCLLFSSPYWDF